MVIFLLFFRSFLIGCILNVVGVIGLGLDVLDIETKRLGLNDFK